MLTIKQLVSASDLLYGRKFSFFADNNLFLCTMIHLDCFAPAFTYSEHAHSFYEFHYILNGKGTVGMNGRVYPLVQGDFYLTSKGITHWQTSDPKSPMIEICIRIQLHGVVVNHSEILQIFELNLSPAKDDGSILPILYSIFEEALNSKLYSQELIGLNLSRFIYTFSRFFSMIPLEKFNYTPNPDIIRLNLINTYIYDHLDEHLTCSKIASQVFICERQLYRIMMKYNGMPPYQYVLSLRLEKAFSLIKNTNLPLKEIAFTTGFSNEFHLSNSIRKRYHITPKEIRMTRQNI